MPRRSLWFLLLAVAVAGAGCDGSEAGPEPPGPEPPGPEPPGPEPPVSLTGQPYVLIEGSANQLAPVHECSPAYNTLMTRGSVQFADDGAFTLEAVWHFGAYVDSARVAGTYERHGPLLLLRLPDGTRRWLGVVGPDPAAPTTVTLHGATVEGGTRPLSLCTWLRFTLAGRPPSVGVRFGPTAPAAFQITAMGEDPEVPSSMRRFPITFVTSHSGSTLRLEGGWLSFDAAGRFAGEFYDTRSVGSHSEARTHVASGRYVSVGPLYYLELDGPPSLPVFGVAGEGGTMGLYGDVFPALPPAVSALLLEPER